MGIKMPTPYMEKVGNIWLNKNGKAAILNLKVGMIVNPYTHTHTHTHTLIYVRVFVQVHKYFTKMMVHICLRAL